MFRQNLLQGNILVSSDTPHNDVYMQQNTNRGELYDLLIDGSGGADSQGLSSRAGFAD